MDDSVDNLFLIESILEGDEYELSFAESGQEALTNIQKSPPDLVLLDIMMPVMDGYEVTRRIRQCDNLPYIPVLLLTAHDHASLVKGLDAGADDFIRKPFDIEELQARVRSLLRMKAAMDAQAHMIRQRDDFVARLTHDLRTPLVAANRMLTFCRKGSFGPVAEDAKAAISATIQNNGQLLEMVNTLLEVYRHDAGHKSLTVIAVNLYDLAEAVVNELTPIAEAKQLQLHISGGSSQTIVDKSSFEIQGDVMELRRLLTNLIGNALKFTDEGCVSVELQQNHAVPSSRTLENNADSAKSWVALKVIDTGVGIAEADQAEIFEWFRQGKQRRSGSGLGLHLAGRIARMHGGCIDVDSALQEGSTFTLFLPSTE
ncbi:MAG: hybrid sensor histidine kinase/response regulator [Cyanobacteria bacterium P01_C01_bin.120]